MKEVQLFTLDNLEKLNLHQITNLKIRLISNDFLEGDTPNVKYEEDKEWALNNINIVMTNKFNQEFMDNNKYKIMLNRAPLRKLIKLNTYIDSVLKVNEYVGIKELDKEFLNSIHTLSRELNTQIKVRKQLFALDTVSILTLGVLLPMFVTYFSTNGHRIFTTFIFTLIFVILFTVYYYAHNYIIDKAELDIEEE